MGRQGNGNSNLRGSLTKDIRRPSSSSPPVPIPKFHALALTSALHSSDLRLPSSAPQQKQWGSTPAQHATSHAPLSTFILAPAAPARIPSSFRLTANPSRRPALSIQAPNKFGRCRNQGSHLGVMPTARVGCSWPPWAALSRCWQQLAGRLRTPAVPSIVRSRAQEEVEKGLRVLAFAALHNAHYTTYRCLHTYPTDLPCLCTRYLAFMPATL